MNFNRATKSDTHLAEIQIPACFDKDQEENVKFEIILFPSEGKKITRSCSVPLYRFKEGDK